MAFASARARPRRAQVQLVPLDARITRDEKYQEMSKACSRAYPRPAPRRPGPVGAGRSPRSRLRSAEPPKPDTLMPRGAGSSFHRLP